MSEFTTPLKHCHNCNRDLPATLEFWHRAKNKRGEPSLATQCKDCANARAKKWANDHPDRVRQKSLDHYWANPELERQKAKDWHKNNPDKVKDYRERNQDKILAYKQTAEYKAKAADYRKRTNTQRLAYNQQYKQDHPGHYTKLAREWRRNNPEKAKAIIHKRIARKHAAPGDYTADDVKRMYVEQDGMCAYCGIRIFMDIRKDVHVDHVMPLSRGGSNGSENLLLSCPTCNHSKNAKTVDEWMSIRGW